MAFACIYVPDFSVQAAVRADTTLRNRALALITGVPPLWHVVAANPAALKAGIQLGMTKAQVTEFTGIEIRERCEAHEKAAHAALLDVGWSISPRVEDTTSGMIVLDLAGLESLFGSDEKIAQTLQQRAAIVGLSANVAVASNIDASIVAARGFAGVTRIPSGEEGHCLGELPVQVLTVGIETLEILARWGIRTLHALGALPVLQLSERLGQEGVHLHALARGSWSRALVLAEPNLQFQEEMELDDSVEELEPLSFLLARLLDQLCARLEARALALRAVHVWFVLEPSFEAELQTTEEESRKKTAREYEKVLTLPIAMRDPKMLLKLLRLLLQGDPPVSPVQKIVLVGDAAPPRVTQRGLFVPKGPDPEKLELTVARLAKLVGEGKVGVAELMDTHRFENFRMRKCGGLAEQTKRRRKNAAVVPPTENLAETDVEYGSAFPLLRSHPRHIRKSGGAPPHSENAPYTGLLGFRAIRPAVPVNVELRETQPARVFFRGAKGEVTSASGPWRGSGDWWQEDAWDQDEWDLAIDFGTISRERELRERRNDPFPARGVYRVFYDALKRSWFMRGFYD
jgi:protein ImuB